MKLIMSGGIILIEKMNLTFQLCGVSGEAIRIQCRTKENHFIQGKQLVKDVCRCTNTAVISPYSY